MLPLITIGAEVLRVGADLEQQLHPRRFASSSASDRIPASSPNRRSPARSASPARYPAAAPRQPGVAVEVGPQRRGARRVLKQIERGEAGQGDPPVKDQRRLDAAVGEKERVPELGRRSR